MSWVAAAIVGSTLISSEMAGNAADTQASAARYGSDTSIAAQERMTDKQIAAQKEALDKQLAAQKDAMERQIALQEPWRQAGITGLNALVPLATNYQKFGMNQFQADPGYAFRLAEGQKALDRQAAARGGLISGSALKAATRYGQDMGSQEYQNAFNRYQTERASQLQPLQSLAGVGQSATNQAGQAIGNYGSGASGAYGAYGANVGNAYGAAGSNISNTLMSGITGEANARASGYIGQANAMNQGLGSYLNYSQNQNMMNALARNQYGPNYGQFTPGSETFVGPMPG